MQIPKITLPSSFELRRPLYLIVPAAGLGTRMGISDSKQFFKINGVPVLARTLLAFSEYKEKTGISIHAVIVTTEDNISRVQELVDEYNIAFVEKIVKGGKTRQDSVACGIAALSELETPPGDTDPVFIHDGARCMVDQDTIASCYAGGHIYDVSVAATPCKNTIKRAAAPKEGTKEKHPLVDQTLDRDTLYEVQTPQVFQYKVLLDVSKRAKEMGITATDDTALAEALGIDVHLIPCSYGNIKITTPEDAAIAEYMLSRR